MLPPRMRCCEVADPALAADGDGEAGVSAAGQTHRGLQGLLAMSGARRRPTAPPPNCMFGS